LHNILATVAKQKETWCESPLHDVLPMSISC